VLSAPGLTHRWNDPAQHEDSAGGLVLGRYLMTTDKRGGLSSTLAASAFDATLRAFMMLHKLRSAMVNSARQPLKGEIEVNAWVGGPPARLRESRARGRRVQARPSQPTFGTHLKGCEVGCGVVGGSCHQSRTPPGDLDELVFRPTDAGCRCLVSKRHSASVPRARLRITA
jgi:hypothetical protein